MFIKQIGISEYKFFFFHKLWRSLSKLNIDLQVIMYLIQNTGGSAHKLLKKMLIKQAQDDYLLRVFIRKPKHRKQLFKVSFIIILNKNSESDTE